MNPIILIGGETGYVGQQYVSFFEQHGIPYFAIPSRSTLPALNREFMVYFTNLVDSMPPSLVINAAGYTGKPNVDSCEKEKSECLQGNVIFAYDVAKACHERDIPLGHVSSGCIYTGSSGEKGFTEDDSPNFSFKQERCSFYSGTKALAEQLLAEFDKLYIWRLRIPFNNINNPRNYLTKLMNYPVLLEAENSISELGEFVRATVSCHAKRVPFGIYNVTNSNSVHTKGVVELLKKYNFPTKEHEYKFFESEDEFMQKAAKTPRSNCVLDNSKLLQCGIPMSDSYEAIENCLKNWKQHNN